MSWKETCPLCKKDIWVNAGQRVIGCGDCRGRIREHNRAVLKRRKDQTNYEARNSTAEKSS